jgi:hypothetical protein
VCSARDGDASRRRRCGPFGGSQGVAPEGLQKDPALLDLAEDGGDFGGSRPLRRDHPPTPQCSRLEHSDTAAPPTERRRRGRTSRRPSDISYIRLASVSPAASHITSVQAGDWVSNADGSPRIISSQTARGAGLTTWRI